MNIVKLISGNFEAKSKHHFLIKIIILKFFKINLVMISGNLKQKSVISENLRLIDREKKLGKQNNLCIIDNRSKVN